HRADDGRALVDAIGPGRHQRAPIVVDPFLAADDAGALEAHLHRRAVGARSLQRKRPARTADRPGQELHRPVDNLDRGAAEFEIVEGGVDVGIIEQTAVGPASDEWIVAHDASLFGSGFDPVVRSTLMYLAP